MSHRRPNKLQTKPLRSFSPAPCNMLENPLSPNSPSATEKLDQNELEKELYLKSGVLQVNNEEIRTKMDEFVTESSLGHGTCGNVYKMRHCKLPNNPMAVKQMRPSSHCFEENKRIFRDLYVVTRCQDCPFIVTCYGIFISQSDVWICMEVMETCLDKLLKKIRNPFPEYVIGKVSCAIIKALQYLKTKHNIMHRDIKPSNMLVSKSGEVKLCDFGISAKLKDSIANSRQPGCIGYMAPERLKSSVYDVRADVWSLGMSLVELGSGRFPIDGFKTEFEIIARIIDDKPPSLPSDGNFSDAFRNFVSSCLQKDFKVRPKYTQLMSSEFYIRHNIHPLDIYKWYRDVSTPSNLNVSTASNLNEILHQISTSRIFTNQQPRSSSSSSNHRTYLLRLQTSDPYQVQTQQQQHTPKTTISRPTNTSSFQRSNSQPPPPRISNLIITSPNSTNSSNTNASIKHYVMLETDL